MWYNASATSPSATRGFSSSTSYGGGATPRKTSTNASSYRLTAAAAVAGSHYRYEEYAATHDSSSLHQKEAAPTYTSASHAYSARAATPNGRASPSSSGRSATFKAPARGYAQDEQRETQTVYRAPASQLHTAVSQREFDPKVGQQQQHPHSSRHVASSRTSGTIVRQRAPSANLPSRGAAQPTSRTSQYLQQSSSSSSSGMAAFCTQVAQPSVSTTTGPSKSSPPRHHGVSKRQADGSCEGHEVMELKKVPKYEEYANVRHPAHYFKDSPLLPYVYPVHRNRHLLVLDLDETLVHASAQMPSSYDAQFNVDMETQIIKIYVKHRPFMMEFLRAASRMFEVCVFTASLSKYANQVLDNIDPHKELVTHRLYREHCTEVDGSYTKDMAILGRPLENVLIVDNSPVAYMFFPNNAIPVTSWFEDESDSELRSLIPKLEIMANSPTALQGLRRTQRRNLL